MTNNFFVEHLNKANQDYFIVDKTAVQISGKVLFSSPNPGNANKCAIESATVFAIDTRTDKVILNTTSNGLGEFNLAVAKQTQLRLEVAYHNHTFELTSESPIGTREGVLVTEAIKELEFEDTTKSTITIMSAVTVCAYDIGFYDLELTMPGCADASTYTIKSLGRESFTVQVPAHVYNFDLTHFEGYDLDDARVDGNTIKKRFEYMFPPTSTIRELNVTDRNENVYFTFHPNIEVKMRISEGLHAPETFANASCSENADIENPPFDLALEGNSYASLRFEFWQEYNDHYRCDILPDGFTLKIVSNLGQQEDPCSTNNDGCDVDVVIEELQLSQQQQLSKYNPIDIAAAN